MPYLHSLDLRREMPEELNATDHWNSVKSFIFYKRSSEVAVNNWEEQELALLLYTFFRCVFRGCN